MVVMMVMWMVIGKMMDGDGDGEYGNDIPHHHNILHHHPLHHNHPDGDMDGDGEEHGW